MVLRSILLVGSRCQLYVSGAPARSARRRPSTLAFHHHQGIPDVGPIRNELQYVPSVKAFPKTLSGRCVINVKMWTPHKIGNCQGSVTGIGGDRCAGLGATTRIAEVY